MSFKFEDLNDKLFEKLIAFSYSRGSGLGGPGVIIMLTSDRKEYVIAVSYTHLDVYKRQATIQYTLVQVPLQQVD